MSVSFTCDISTIVIFFVIIFKANVSKNVSSFPNKRKNMVYLKSIFAIPKEKSKFACGEEVVSF